MTTFLAPPVHDFTGSVPLPADLLALVDALAPEQALVLRLPAPAGRSLLETLTTERKGLFEWSPDTDGRIVTVGVTRRDATPGSSRGVLEALAWDHDRLDALETAAFEARAAGNPGEAAGLYAQFARGLARHIGFEEDLLFPLLESRLGFPPSAGPTAVMRMEHLEIRALLDRIRAAIGDPAVDPLPLRQRLHAVLIPHNEKEERILYPMADARLSAQWPSLRGLWPTV